MLSNSQEIIDGYIVNAPLCEEVRIVKQYRRGNTTFRRIETYVIYNDGNISEIRGGFAFQCTPQTEKRIREEKKRFQVVKEQSPLDHKPRLTITYEDPKLPTLLCPVCGYSYTHIESAYTRMGYDEEESGVYPGTAAEAGPATQWRRSGVVIKFYCEGGHRFEILFQQHKGENFVLLSRLEDSKDKCWVVDEKEEAEFKAVYDASYGCDYEQDFAKDHAEWLRDHAIFSDGIYKIST